MNNKVLIDKLRAAISQEFVRRSLIKYFSDKNYTNFMVSVYPPSIKDLPVVVAELANKIEVVPYVTEFDPISGKAVIGWNLFVLGNNRMDLGESVHSNVTEIERATLAHGYGGKKTPKDIIDFIMKVLSTSKAGMISNVDNNSIRNLPEMPLNKPSTSGQFYRRKHNA